MRKSKLLISLNCIGKDAVLYSCTSGYSMIFVVEFNGLKNSKTRPKIDFLGIWNAADIQVPM